MLLNEKKRPDNAICYDNLIPLTGRAVPARLLFRSGQFTKELHRPADLIPASLPHILPSSSRDILQMISPHRSRQLTPNSQQGIMFSLLAQQPNSRRFAGRAVGWGRVEPVPAATSRPPPRTWALPAQIGGAGWFVIPPPVSVRVMDVQSESAYS